MSLTARRFHPEDWAALGPILALSFNVSLSGWDLFRQRLGDPGFYVVEHGGRIIGGCGVYAMGQQWLDRSLPLAGVAGVGIAPHARGLGAARFLMEAVLCDQAERGVPLAGLYPATQTVYRTVGYEQAGDRVQFEAPLASLYGFRAEVEVQPAGPADEEEIRRRYRPVHGNIDRCPAMWERIFRGPGGARHVWLIGDQGYVVLQHSPVDNPHHDLELVDLMLPDGPSVRTLLAFLAGHRSLASKVRWFGHPTDELLAFLPEPTWRVAQHQRWMLRVVDLIGALQGRGWPPEVEGELDLEVEDALLPANHGRFRLKVGAGQARVQRGGSGALRLPVSSLGPLFSGFVPASTLVRWGRAAGEAQALAVADRLFQAPVPWMREMY